MWRFFSPFGQRRPLKHDSITHTAGFVEGSGLSSARVDVDARHRARLTEMQRSKPNSTEIRVWVTLFGLLILAIVVLMYLVMKEGSVRASPIHATVFDEEFSSGPVNLV
jgi:hypothetical protein